MSIGCKRQLESTKVKKTLIAETLDLIVSLVAIKSLYILSGLLIVVRSFHHNILNAEALSKL